MPFGAAFLLCFEHDDVEIFRRQYDPTAGLIQAHLTVLFLIPDTVEEAIILDHLRRVVEDTPSIEVRVTGLSKSWDHWMMLNVAQGSEQVSALHERIYSGVLSEYFRHDLKFVPHVALGLFVENDVGYSHEDPAALTFDSARYAQALTEAEALKVDHHCLLDKLHLLRFSRGLDRIVASRELQLANP